MKRTSSVRAQKKQMQVLDRFMRDEAHQSYDIFTGTRKETKVWSNFHEKYNLRSFLGSQIRLLSSGMELWWYARI